MSCSTPGKVYEGSIGTEIILDTGENLTGATSLKILYKKPDGTTGEWTATQVDVNKVRYITIAEDFAIGNAGEWELMADVVLPSWSGPGETFQFILHARFS